MVLGEQTINGFDCREIEYVLQQDIDFYLYGFRYNPTLSDWEIFNIETGELVCQKINCSWVKVQ
jgi:hypothetical protein